MNEKREREERRETDGDRSLKCYVNGASTIEEQEVHSLSSDTMPYVLFASNKECTVGN